MARAGALSARRGALALGTAALLCAGASRVRAQPLARRADGDHALRPEAGVTVAVAAHPLALATAGLTADAGLTTRLALTAGVGARSGDPARTVGELAATARFLLDPLRQASRGVYATGGGAARIERGRGPRWLVLAGLGVEGRPRGGVVPAVEAGVGGGVRVGLVLRPARPTRR